MAPEPCGLAPASNTRRLSALRVPLLLVLLCVTLAGVFYVQGRLKKPQDLARRCAEAMFAENLEAAFEAFAEYRELAQDDVPDSVRDEVFRLQGDKDFPLGPGQDDSTQLRYLIERAVFFSLAAESALAGVRSGDLRGAALSVLAYVRRNVQSGVGGVEFPDIAVTPVHVLCRGYGCALESAWLMACLLRIRGIHAAVVELPPPSEGAERYYIVGVLIEQKLYLFDPYRGVPLCRASDGCVADLETLLDENDSLAPEFGGPGKPVSVEGLRSAAYFVPADAGNVLPDAFLLGRIVSDKGRYETLYRSFRRDLGNLAAAVFGSRVATSMLEDRFTTIAFHGRREIVALWDLPFKVDDLLLNRPDYRKKLADVHAALPFYLAARHAHLFKRPGAAEQYAAVLRNHADKPAVVHDVAFFKAVAQDDRDKRAAELAAYLAEYPSGRFRALATLLLAEIEAARTRFDSALDLVAQVQPPYDLRAGLLRAAIQDGKGIIAWQFPRHGGPDSGDGR